MYTVPAFSLKKWASGAKNVRQGSGRFLVYGAFDIWASLVMDPHCNYKEPAVHKRGRESITFWPTLLVSLTTHSHLPSVSAVWMDPYIEVRRSLKGGWSAAESSAPAVSSRWREDERLLEAHWTSSGYWRRRDHCKRSIHWTSSWFWRRSGH